MRLRALSLAASGVVAMGLSVAPGVDAVPAPTWTIRPVISHLNAPRGLSFDGQGSLYIAEAGRPGAGAFGVTRTGAVDKYRWAGGSLAPAWSTPFTSTFQTAHGGADVLGPAAVSATGSNCSGHRSGDRGDGAEPGACRVTAILSQSRRSFQAQTGLTAPQIGHLYRLDGATGAATNLSDFGDQSYQWTADHAALFEDFPDSNPYAVLTIRGDDRGDGHGEDGDGERGDGERHSAGTFVANAGANTISRILPDGRSRVIAYIPNETSGAFRDATPTCIAQGPDGALYVGALDLLSNFAVGPGQSNVWRVDPNRSNWRHNATLWATGFTTVDGCTFDRQGNFWASELFYPNAAGPPGDLAMSSFHHPSEITHVGGGSLPLPGGIAQGPDGALYVSTGAADTTPGAGAVVRVGAN